MNDQSKNDQSNSVFARTSSRLGSAILHSHWRNVPRKGFDPHAADTVVMLPVGAGCTPSYEDSVEWVHKRIGGQSIRQQFGGYTYDIPKYPDLAVSVDHHQGMVHMLVGHMSTSPTGIRVLEGSWQLIETANGVEFAGRKDGKYVRMPLKDIKVATDLVDSVKLDLKTFEMTREIKPQAPAQPSVDV